jgi:hypothetical protein
MNIRKFNENNGIKWFKNIDSKSNVILIKYQTFYEVFNGMIKTYSGKSLIDAFKEFKLEDCRLNF